MEDIGDNRLRISYDFQTEDQLLDWSPADADSPALSIDASGRLRIERHALQAVNVALFVQLLRVDSVTSVARILDVEGSHVNVYVDTIWDGGWAPTQGLACIHRWDGRNVFVDGEADPAPSDAPALPGVDYHNAITVTDDQLTWIVNDTAHDRTYAPRARSTLRQLAVGAFDSIVAFDEIRIEGELAE